MTEENTLPGSERGDDLHSFKKIVDAHKVKVYRTAFDMLGTREDAEDVSQEVFLKAYRSLDRFRGEAKLSTWLYRITINACHDVMARKAYRTTRPSEDLDDTGNAEPMFRSMSTDSPAEEAEAAIIGDHIETALGALTPRERSVFVLRHYQDLPMKDIAAALNISDGTVRSTLFRALKRLQKELSHYKPEMGLEEPR